MHQISGSHIFASSKPGKVVREDFLEEVILDRLEDFGQRQRNWKSASEETNSRNKHQEAEKNEVKLFILICPLISPAATTIELTVPYCEVIFSGNILFEDLKTCSPSLSCSVWVSSSEQLTITGIVGGVQGTGPGTD